ncbi:hypothetical protein Tco_0304146 [Tanacetum coccineum]
MYAKGNIWWEEEKRGLSLSHQEAGKQEKNQMGLLTMDDGIVNWGEHTKAKESNHALMAISSSNESTTQMAHANAVMGSWGSAVKSSASYNWRNPRPNFNYNSGPTFIRTDITEGTWNQANHACLLAELTVAGSSIGPLREQDEGSGVYCCCFSCQIPEDNKMHSRTTPKNSNPEET